jgi:cytochrome c-type biogenesis protein CcmH/NrfG
LLTLVLALFLLVLVVLGWLFYLTIRQWDQSRRNKKLENNYKYYMDELNKMRQNRDAK